jgi:hypothetical protein
MPFHYQIVRRCFDNKWAQIITLVLRTDLYFFVPTVAGDWLALLRRILVIQRSIFHPQPDYPD